MKDKKRTIGIIMAVVLGLFAVLYLGGMMSQVLSNYSVWMNNGGLTGQAMMKPVNMNPLVCIPLAFTANGLKAIVGMILIGGAIFIVYKLYNRFDGKHQDPRGFTKSDSGIYGTASWMDEKEMHEVLEISSIGQVEGTILGEYKGKAVCMPKDTRLNRHIAIFGASGTMKSRAIIRNALFQIIRRGESAILTDSKSEMYTDTVELFRNAGYEVKVFNLVNPEHGDSWNCMSDLNGDTLMAQVLTNVIIGNTSSGKGDHFWDNGEGNLLKALILMVDQDILGDIYHELRLNNEWNGQFFTPNHICRLMAQLANVDVPEDKEGPITINEPACGSGTMVIGAVWAMQRKGIDYRRKSFFVAQDIDIRCVWMAYIQLSLYGIPAVVIHGNTLTMETWSQWYTPCAAVPFADIEQESSNTHRIDDEKGEAQCECESKLPVTAKESCSNRQTA